MNEFSDTDYTDVDDVADDAWDEASAAVEDAADTVDFDSLDVLGEDTWEEGSDAGEPADFSDLETLPEDVEFPDAEYPALDEMIAEYEVERMAEIPEDTEGDAPYKVKVLTR